MEKVPKRLSMNTSLKNARIFDEDSWDAETVGCSIKKEIKDEEEPTVNFSFTSTLLKIKQEIEDESEQSNSITEDFEPKLFGREIKKEEDENSYDSIESENGRKFEIPNTPIKTEINSELRQHFLIENSNPSPFTKEHFKNFGLDSPNRDEYVKSETRKTPKRTIFTRHSPYKRDIPDNSTNSIKDRLGPPVSNTFRKRTELESSESYTMPVKKRYGSIEWGCGIPMKKFKKQELETDTQILARRQKQIDYGKNTLSYDNYIRRVPRDERSQDDPQTPNKHFKYSRRGWDGLIKQWRLKLHKYDEESD